MAVRLCAWWCGVTGVCPLWLPSLSPLPSQQYQMVLVGSVEAAPPALLTSVRPITASASVTNMLQRFERQQARVSRLKVPKAVSLRHAL